MRVLHLQNIAPLDKLPKTQAVHIGSVPLHSCLFLAFRGLSLASIKMVYWEGPEGTQKNRMLSLYVKIL